MKNTRQIIDDNKKDFSEFQYYHNIIDKIEENVEKMPDITIESCKALVEGVSKTILNKLGVSYLEKGRNADSPRDLLKKVLDKIPNSVPHDPEFITRSCELVARMADIRNKNGDISHGKSSPKEKYSDTNLAEFIIQVTDSTVLYLLKIYFNADLSSYEEIKYEDNEEFNQFLDEENQLGGIVLYSRALYNQDLTSYEEQLKDYLLKDDEEKEII